MLNAIHFHLDTAPMSLKNSRRSYPHADWPLRRYLVIPMPENVWKIRCFFRRWLMLFSLLFYFQTRELNRNLIENVKSI